MAEGKEAKVVKAKVDVVTLGDYIGRIGNDLAGQDKVKAALVLLYSENKVIARIERKGDEYYIVEK